MYNILDFLSMVNPQNKRYKYNAKLQCTTLNTKDNGAFSTMGVFICLPLKYIFFKRMSCLCVKSRQYICVCNSIISKIFWRTSVFWWTEEEIYLCIFTLMFFDSCLNKEIHDRYIENDATIWTYATKSDTPGRNVLKVQGLAGIRALLSNVNGFDC